MVEEAYCRHVGEPRQRQGQGHLGEYRVDMIRLSCAILGGGEGKGEGSQVQQLEGPTYKES